MNQYGEILTLARAGNPVRAWERFVDLGLDRASGDIKALTLKGRLLKDLGTRATGAERLRLFSEASRSYLAANALKTDSYPLINAATLALLSQDAAQTAALAEQVLTLISANPNEGETPYWREATRAEALLLLGRRNDAEAALVQGIARLPRAWEDHAATIGQLERIVAVQGGDASWLDRFRPAPAVHFSGLIGLDPEAPGLTKAISDEVAGLGVGFAYGALAAGADILIAEAIVEAGGLLHAVLPFGRERFRKVSVEPYGAHWVSRFDALIEQAETVEELWEVNGEVEEWLAQLVAASDLAAMGQALRRAEILRTSAHALAIKAKGEGQRSHLTSWEKAGLPLRIVETNRLTGARSTDARATQVTASLAATGLLWNGSEQRPGFEVIPGTDTASWAGTIGECLAAALDLQRSQPDASFGLAAFPVTTPVQRAQASALATRLAQSARAGSLYVDHRTAMIAKVLSPASRVEQMGEFGSHSGPITVCAMAPDRA